MGKMGRLVRVGITGQGGFMGSHLYNFLGTKIEEIKRISFKGITLKTKLNYKIL